MPLDNQNRVTPWYFRSDPEVVQLITASDEWLCGFKPCKATRQMGAKVPGDSWEYKCFRGVFHWHDVVTTVS
jgi:hypothetical protein